jgi:hypothetical protein
VVPGDAAATLENVAAAPLEFRLGILADTVMALSDVALAGVLYVLFAPVNRTLSLMAMAFRLVQAAILGVNLVNLHSAVALATSDGIEAGMQSLLVLRAIDAHAAGYDFGLFFFAMNCFLVGVLILRSGIIPKLLGWLLMGAGAVYLVGSLLRVVAPALVDTVAPAYLLPLVAELGFCLWLIARGARAFAVNTWVDPQPS